MMNIKNKYTKISWVAVLTAMMILIAPTNTAAKFVTNEVSPFLVSAIRYGVAALILFLPAARSFRRFHSNIKKKLPSILGIAIVVAIPVSFYTYAVAISSASFIAVVNLLDPILFVIISTIIMRDKITHKSLLGLMFAILGSLSIVLFPNISGVGEVARFGYLSIVIMLAAMLATTFWQIALRRFDENKIPLSFPLCISFFMISTMSIILAISNNGSEIIGRIADISPTNWLAILYLAAIVTVVARFVRVLAYENIGTAAYAIVGYIKYVLAIIIPLILLNETLSVEMVVGAILIMIGIIIIGDYPIIKRKR